MAKLYFRYGTMSSGKSIELLRVNFNYNEYGEKVICLTSAKDDRYGKGKIASRIGIQAQAISIYDGMNVYELIYMFYLSAFQEGTKISCVLVDEAQFLTKKQVFHLADVVDILDIPVICYGLRSDFLMEPFEGSKYLMIVADNVEEIKTICCNCRSQKALINSRFKNGKLLTEGEQVQIGGNETYRPLCRKCYKKILNGAASDSKK